MVSLICVLVFALFGESSALLPKRFDGEKCEFQNPIVPNGQDPWVTLENGTYYYSYSNYPNEIHVRSFQRLEEINVPGRYKDVNVFTAEPGHSYSENLWAPEVWWFDDYGKWYIYFTAGSGEIPSQRMHVLESKTNDPLDGFEYKTQLQLPENQYSIDGTVLKVRNNIYFVWSGWPSDRDQTQKLYISRMMNPYSIDVRQKRNLISEPTFDWEKEFGKINEGPEQLTSENGFRVFIVYSAQSANERTYQLGMIELKNFEEPMKKESWSKFPSPVFAESSNVFGPGHASFTQSPSLKEHWIVYHSKVSSSPGWERVVDTQQFSFVDGIPQFGVPTELYTNITCPQ